MTTRVHIVNFGPQAVSVKPEPNKAAGSILYAQQSTDVYVYGEQTITVEEVASEPLQTEPRNRTKYLPEVMGEIPQENNATKQMPYVDADERFLD